MVNPSGQRDDYFLDNHGVLGDCSGVKKSVYVNKNERFYFE
jgi:hypothetical protein